MLITVSGTSGAKKALTLSNTSGARGAGGGSVTGVRGTAPDWVPEEEEEEEEEEDEEEEEARVLGVAVV
jgi:hypothetical protein